MARRGDTARAEVKAAAVWLDEHWRGEAFIPRELLPLDA
jgi:hypothetical protein